MNAMRRSQTRSCGAVSVGVALSLSFMTQPAEACDCNGPAPHFLIPDGHELPSNARAVPYAGRNAVPLHGGQPCDRDGGPDAPKKEEFSVQRIEDGDAIDVGFEVQKLLEQRPKRLHRCASLVLVVLTDPLQPGGTYRFSGPGAAIKLRVSDKSLESKGKPSLRLGPRKSSEFTVAAAGSCSMETEASTVDVTIVLPTSARAFEDSLLFTTYVNSEVWRPSPNMCSAVDVGRSWQGLGNEMLYGGCSTFGGLDALRPYEVRMEAVLPGTNVRFVSETVQVAPFCEPAPPVQPSVWSGCGKCTLTGAPAGKSKPLFAPFAVFMLVAAPRWLHRRKRSS